MCGIFGYVGRRRALAPFLLKGLKRLEYRGYDSAGIVVLAGKNRVFSQKTAGDVASLERKLKGSGTGAVGLGHTRWATHGAATDLNAHPHTDCRRNLWLIHNGIIENYVSLKAGLEKRGHRFYSETDTEALAHLIEEFYPKHSLRDSVKRAMALAQGAYAIAVAAADDPTRIVAARLSSPLIIGIGKGEMFLASDAAAIVPYTKKVIYVDDGEIVELSRRGYTVVNLVHGTNVQRVPTIIHWDVAESEKGGYRHFFLKEIFEQPEALANTIRGRVLPAAGEAKLGGLEQVAKRLKQAERVTFVGCGTAAIAGQVGKLMLESFSRMHVESEIASEYRYRAPLIKGTRDVVVAISQSGETADTLAALRLAKERKALTLGVVNVVGSTISRETDAGVYNHVGPEISVASTKAFTSQVAVLALLALFLAEQRGRPLARRRQLAQALAALPALAEQTLRSAPIVEKLAKKYSRLRNALFIGRKYSYPVALEGAIKLKEVTYLHAEGMPAGEIKHHSIALIDKDFLTVAVAPDDDVAVKTMINMKEIKARGGPIIAVTTTGNTAITDVADDVIYVPKTMEMLSPILTIIPLQLFAYYVGVERGVNLDRPRNLAKSVTVE